MRINLVFEKLEIKAQDVEWNAFGECAE